MSENYSTDAFSTQRIQILRDDCERINSFIDLHSQKKVNATYVKILTFEILSKMKLLLNQTLLMTVNEHFVQLLNMLTKMKETINKTETLA